MKTFTQYLEEGRDYPLYHGTSAYRLPDIIVLGFNPITAHGKDKIPPRAGKNFTHGTSFSRSLAFAKNHGSGIVIEVDQTAIAKRYRIEPVNYFNASGARDRSRHGRHFMHSNESEEFIISSKNIPFYPYAKRLYIRANKIAHTHFQIMNTKEIESDLTSAREAEMMSEIQKSIRIPVVKYLEREV